MRRRLYFLLPDIASATEVVEELLLARIEVGHMHVVAQEGADLSDLPKASILQKSDVVHAMELGLVLGGLTGAVAGFVAISVPGLAEGMNGGLVLSLAIAGAVVGTWAAGMIGSDAPNSRLQAFSGRLSQGQLLLMVDVPKGRVDEITAMVHGHHPEADSAGTEPTIPAFP